MVLEKSAMNQGYQLFAGFIREHTKMYRVVIADDGIETLEFLRTMLTRCGGYRVVGEASDGAEVVALVEALRPDVVISDVEMPQMDGIDVLRHVRRRWPETKVILLSSHLNRSCELIAKDLGALACIPKSELSPASLAHALGEEV